MTSDRSPDDRLGLRHLLWVPCTVGLAFLSSFVFADFLRLPAPVYHAVYFTLVAGFFGLYAQRTRLPLRTVLRRRLVPALVFGVLGGLVLARRVLVDAPSAGPQGFLFLGDLFWRGLVYGTVDGLLLSAFPWLVTWRALSGERSSLVKCAGVNLLALGLALVVTSAYHLGYRDFRGPKLVQAIIGNAIATLPTLLSANPMASPLAHAILHIAALAHNPQSDLFLPPHALESARGEQSDETIGGSEGPLIEFPLRGVWRIFQPPGHGRHAFDFVAVGNEGGYSSKPLAGPPAWGPARSRIGTAGRSRYTRHPRGPSRRHATVGLTERRSTWFAMASAPFSSLPGWWTRTSGHCRGTTSSSSPARWLPSWLTCVMAP